MTLFKCMYVYIECRRVYNGCYTKTKNKFLKIIKHYSILALSNVLSYITEKVIKFFR